ncbi:MAG: hypothetical protein K1X67_06895 [Fimbriimonadaceae bacterium]|nr:hypothetical protein [Fimbriimonadaceae bacterium]
MKAGWVVFGVVVASILLATIWSIGNGLTATTRFRESALREGDKMLPPILEDWSVAELRGQAAPQLLENNSEQDIAKMMADLKARLGPLRSLGKSEAGNVHSPSVKNEGGPFMVVDYQATGTFEKGKAVIEVKLVRSEGKWRIGNFFVRDAKPEP